MSRIGKQPIELPSGVTCAIEGNEVIIQGPKGEIITPLPPKVAVKQHGDVLEFSVPNPKDSRQAAFWGLGRSLVANAVLGVTEGFEKKLEINGVGYKVALKGSELVLNVGYSHPVTFTPPEGITLTTESNTISVIGINKQLVGMVAAEIRKIRKPEPYKGKGIKYVDEIIRRKAGKVLKGTEGGA